MQTAAQLFDIWYVQPLRALENLPGGAGGFIALATSCFLYERYAKALIRAQGSKASEENLIRQFAEDFDTDQETATCFWKEMRHGLLHQGMPKKKERGSSQMPHWAFHDSFPAVALATDAEGARVLLVQPWKIMHKVIDLWGTKPDLLEASDDFPWASIGPVSVMRRRREDAQTQGISVANI